MQSKQPDQAHARRRAHGTIAIVAAALIVLVGAVGASAAALLSQEPGTAGCVSSATSTGSCQPGTALKGATRVVISADGKNAYVASYEADSITIFDRDPATGALTQKPGKAGCFSDSGTKGACVKDEAVEGARSIALSADGKFAYSAADDSSAVAIFRRDPSTGALTQVRGKAGCISSDGDGCRRDKRLSVAYKVALSPDGKSLYVAARGRYKTHGAIVVFGRNPATGALSSRRGKAGCITDSGDHGACTKDPSVGDPVDLLVSPDGNSVYTVNSTTNRVATFARNPATGALRPRGAIVPCRLATPGRRCSGKWGFGADGNMAISPDGHNLYLTGLDSGAVGTFDRNPQNGQLTQKPGGAGCISAAKGHGDCAVGKISSEMEGITVSPDGRTVYAGSYTTGLVAIFDRDPATGELTPGAGPAECLSEEGGDCQPARAIKGISGIAVSPDEKNVYVAGRETSSIAAFDQAATP